jgi:predicted porin
MKKIYTFILVACGFIVVNAQDDMLSLLGEEKTIDYATASFKTTRIINTLSIENNSKGVLDFKINHRFGPLNGGFYDLFGIDQAFIRFGFEYGLTDRLNIGVGRNSYEKVYDGFLKYKILRQSTGARNMPISLSYAATMDYKTAKTSDIAYLSRDWLRAYYTHQLLIARKFGEGTTVQLMPTLVHRNYVKTKAEKNDVYLIGIGARQKLSKRIAVNVEYFYNLPNQLSSAYVNSLSVGFDIETGGHVFQLFFTNSSGTDTRNVLTETTGKWSNGDIRFGFNVSRVFTVYKPKNLDN